MVSDQLLSEIAAGKGEKLTQLARRVPSYRSGRPASLSRLLRWILSGVNGPGDQRVYLEAAKTPGGWISTPAALTRFFAELTPQHGQPSNPIKKGDRTPKQQFLAAEKAAQKLSKLGI